MLNFYKSLCFVIWPYEGIMLVQLVIIDFNIIQLNQARFKIQMSKKFRSSKHRNTEIPNFINKAYEILEKPQNEQIISWNADGTQFCVKKITQFTENILPKYFKHNNYSSFIRQLNMYGFHKVKSDNSDQTFKHEKFVKDRKDLLPQIKRRVNTDVALKQQEIQSFVLDRTNKELQGNIGQELASMKKKQQQLQKIVDVLVEQNKQILQDNKHLWNKMKKTVDKEEKKIEKVLFLMMLSGNNILQKQKELEMKEENYLQEENPKEQAMLPFQDPKNKKGMLETLYRSFANKKSKNKSKNKFEDELFLHNQGQHFKIINNLMNHINNSKIDEKKKQSNMLQIQGQPNQQMQQKIRQENYYYSPSNILLSPVLRPQQQDQLNGFTLQKSESEFRMNPLNRTVSNVQQDEDQNNLDDF